MSEAGFLGKDLDTSGAKWLKPEEDFFMRSSIT
jgi:hypothetical protein